jgi:hypothetical protein
VPSATQPSAAGIRPLTPRPEPAPSSPTTLRSTGRATAHGAALAGRQARQRHGQRGEVVDHHQRLETQALAHLFDGELPVVVGHPHLVAFHRVGDGHRRVVDVGCGARRQGLQVGADSGEEVGMLGTAQRARVLKAARAVSSVKRA